MTSKISSLYTRRQWVKVRNTCTQVDQITHHDGQTRYKNVNIQCHIRIVLFAMCVSCIDLLVIPEKYSLTNVYIITVQKDLDTNTHFPHFQYRKAGMMTWSNGNIFHVTGPLWGESPGNPLDCPHKGQWRGALMFSLVGAWTNGSANNRDACDLRRHRTNYDVTVMYLKKTSSMKYFILTNAHSCHYSFYRRRSWNILPGKLIHCLIDMMTSSNGNIFRITGPLCGEFTAPGEFHAQRPVTQSFDVFFHLRLNKRLSKHSRGWWFETLSRPLWRHCNVCCLIDPLEFGKWYVISAKLNRACGHLSMLCIKVILC